MTLTLKLRNGDVVTVAESGRIDYRFSHNGRTLRREGLGSYADSAAWVRGSAWHRDARFIVEQ